MNRTRANVPPERLFGSAARRLFMLDPAAHCRLLGMEMSGEPEILPATLPPVTLPDDVLLLRVGPGQLAHVVHVMHRTDELSSRMLMQGWAIGQAYPEEEVEQYLVVLGEDEKRSRSRK